MIGGGEEQTLIGQRNKHTRTHTDVNSDWLGGRRMQVSSTGGPDYRIEQGTKAIRQKFETNVYCPKWNVPSRLILYARELLD